MRASGHGAKNAWILVGGLVAGCGSVAITQGDWALTAGAKDAAAPPVEAADEPMDDSMPWTVPPTNVGSSSSSGGSSSSSGGASSGSSGGQDAGSSSGSSTGPAPAPCTSCASDSDCSMTACGPPAQTGYYWCCVKSVGQCASQSYTCGMSSSGGDGGKSSSSSGGGPCGGNGEQCCTGMLCPNSPTQMCFMNKCY